MDQAADLIVSAVLELAKSRPAMLAIDVLDAAMRGHHGSDLSFEAPPGTAFADCTDDASPFGQLLRSAFGPATGDPQKVLDRYADRYRLWGACGDTPSGAPGAGSARWATHIQRVFR